MENSAQYSNTVGEYAGKLLGSLLLFIQFFYKLRTGKEFIISEPIGRISHHKIISRYLTRTMDGELNRLIIEIPPRYGKTEILIHYVAWALARYPDSNFLYISYSHNLASLQTQRIRSIVTLPLYRQLFGVRLSKSSTAKDNFETEVGGSVYAAGSGGTITGRGAGIQNEDRYGGAIIIDDILKPNQVPSDAAREKINDWYFSTLQSRVNNPKITPIIFSGQALGQGDLGDVLRNLKVDKLKLWERLAIPALDESGNALNPKFHSTKQLLEMKKTNSYWFSTQYQQVRVDHGGGVFKPHWFLELEEEPKIISTFLTVDTAETSKTYNDATVFSFWGIYKIKQGETETNLYGLHWLKCHEWRGEPKDLYSEFMFFYQKCMRCKKPPTLAAIEKKSTGVTLLSMLEDLQGIRVLDIKRNTSSESKANRFIRIEPFVSSKRVTLPYGSKHTKLVRDHLKRITYNNSQPHDDIADTLADAVQLALIDKIVFDDNNKKSTEGADSLSNFLSHKINSLSKKHELSF